MPTQTIKNILARYDLGHYVPTEENRLFLFDVEALDLPEVIKILKHTHKLPLKTVVATDEREEGVFKIRYVFGVPQEKQKNIFIVPTLTIDKYLQAFPSLTPLDQELSVYEEEIKTFFGLLPMGHPRARRTILHEENYPSNTTPLLKDFQWNKKIKSPLREAIKAPAFQKFEGEDVYEVPVGPVHAGIIEPGHFRFSVLGEEMLRLEPRLGYVHKGTEKLFEALPIEQKLKLSERISGDSSYHHALAFVQALETMSATAVPERGKLLRVVYAELERLANHFNDLAFIMLDTGLSFGGSHGTRLRERVLQWNEKLTGSRFLRGVVVPGGVSSTSDIDKTMVDTLADDLELLENDWQEVKEAVTESESFLQRAEGTGKLDPEIAKDHGVVGIAARAVGISIDARRDFPYAGYDAIQFDVPTETSGDVYARFMIRVREVDESFRILNQILTLLPYHTSPIALPLQTLPKSASGVGIVEGWRGDIVYFVMTDKDGVITRVKVRDPSFLNWKIFPYVVQNDMLPDFPLINKSFNLSYTGNDL